VLDNDGVCGLYAVLGRADTVITAAAALPCSVLSAVDGLRAQYEQIIAEIEQIGGVVTHGLLMNVADAVVVADQKQGVRVVECEKKQQAAAAASGSSS
jgi:hypothetical protein